LLLQHATIDNRNEDTIDLSL